MKKHIDGIEMFYAKDPTAWRAWLEKNHLEKRSVWLVYKKLSNGKRSLAYADAVEEALCFGWIDSKAVRLDDVRTLQYFARRSPKSNWSKLNKDRIASLIKQKRMHASGVEMVKVAKRNGTWHALQDADNLTIPNDLHVLFERNQVARQNFMAFPRSAKRAILEWIFNAKKAGTREKRIQETVRLATENRRANEYRKPDSKQPAK